MKASLVSDMNVLIALPLSSVSVLLAKELASHNGELNASYQFYIRVRNYSGEEGCIVSEICVKDCVKFQVSRLTFFVLRVRAILISRILLKILLCSKRPSCVKVLIS